MAAASSYTASGSSAVPEQLDEAYVHFQTQLLVHLQRRDTEAALKTAAAMRAALAQTPTGADLFASSPAAQLLLLQNEITAAVILLPQVDATAGTGQEHSFCSGQPSPSATSSTQSSDSSMEDVDEGTSDDESDVDMVAQQEPQEAQDWRSTTRHLEKVLTTWGQQAPAPTRTKPTPAPANMTTVSLQPSQAATTAAMKTPHPPPRQASSTTKTKPNSRTHVSKHSPASPKLDRGADDADADAMWSSMQAEVAKEMEQLARVRKHR